MRITSEQVRTLWSEALTYHGGKVGTKSDSTIMKAAGSFLDLIGVLDKQNFMDQFTTTILDIIYVPFEVGTPNAQYDLDSQVMILAHELVHVMQFKNDPAGFVFNYLGKKSKRAEYEAMAYSSDMEVFYWAYGYVYDANARAISLLNYGLKQEHVEYCASVLESIGETIVQGASVNPVAAWVINWLEANKIPK